MKNILVTGINGFIGAHLAEYLSRDENNKIYGIIRSEKHDSTFNALRLSSRKNISIIHGDVYIYTLMEELLVQYNINEVYHLAAKVIVRGAAKTPLVSFMINANGTLNILEALRLMKAQYNLFIPTLIMSSDKAYGSSDNLPYKETHPLNANDIYSSTKAIQDILARTYANQYELPIVVARPANTYGSYDFNWSRIVPSLAKSCFSKEEVNNPLVLNKNSYQNLREYMYVSDTVNALIQLINNIDKTRGNAYNIGSGEKLTTERILNKFFELSDIKKEIEFKEKDSIFKEIPEQYLDTTKIKNAIGWKPEYSIEEGLKLTIEGYKEWFAKYDKST